MTARRDPQVHRPEDLASLPRVSADDVKAALWLIAAAAIVIALCAVPPVAGR